MRVDFSVRRFPVTPELSTKCGLPFSCVVQPFATPEDQGDIFDQEVASVDDVARCSSCFSYVNCYSAFSPAGWTCSICGKANNFRAYARSRYQLPPKELALLPEVSCHAYEAAVGAPVPIAAGPTGFSGPAPVYVALVDVGAGAPGGGPEFVELVRSALEAALEALPPAALFGLITFSDKLALHDLRADVPTSRVLPLSGPHQLPVPLAEVMPLKALLAPVGAFKGRIADALEGLLPDPGCASAPAPAAPPGSVEPMSRAAGGASGGGGGGGAVPPRPVGPPGCRALGPALLAVLDYLRGLQQPPFVAGARGSGSGEPGAQAIAELLPDAVSPLHLMLFLSGPADQGPGRVVKPKRAKAPASGAVSAEAAAAVAARLRALEAEEQAEQARGYLGGSAYERDTLSFYEGAAVAAASLGACVDVFAVSPGLVGLPTLEAVCNSTGGAMYLYPSADESALPQDVYRRLSGARASAGLLRVRTSHGFRPSRFYGRLFPDRQYDNLHHVIACDASDTFVVELEHASRLGFAADDVVLQPTIQIAFQYTSVVAAGPSQGLPDSQGPGTAHLALQRRLRVVTLRMSVTRDGMELYRHCSPDAVLCMLMHRVATVTDSATPEPTDAAASADSTPGGGDSPKLAQARILLRDWLATAAAGYARASTPRASPAQLAAAPPPDLAFADAPALASLPRLVYALLRSPLLATPPRGQHPDLTPFMRHLWACLPPGELQAAVYPSLSCWASPQEMTTARAPLCRASVRQGPAAAGSSPPLLLLDAYIVVVLMLASSGAGTPFPPPQGTALAKAVASIRAARRISPRVRYVREGTDEADLFFQLLLDEADDAPPAQAAAAAASHGSSNGGSSNVNGAGGSQGGQQQQQRFGLSQFMDHVRSECVLHLQQS